MNLSFEPALPRIWDFTQLDCARQCMRKFLFNYVWRLRGLNKSIALGYGSAFHEMLRAYYIGHPNPMEAFTTVWKEGEYHLEDEDKRRNPELAESYLIDYAICYADDPLEPKLVEVKQTLPIGTGQGEEHMFAFKIDLIGELEGDIVPLDHKTAGLHRGIWAPAASLSQQFAGYAYCARELFGTSRFGINAIYTGVKDPALRFQRIYRDYTDYELDQWLIQTIWRIRQIEALEEFIEEPLAWEMNSPSACLAYFSLCPFYTLCAEIEDADAILTTNFVREEWSPSEASDGAECQPIQYKPPDVELYI